MPNQDDDLVSELGSVPSRANISGRPRCAVPPAEVLRLRSQALSWRQIAKALKIGTATAMRLSKQDTVPNPSQKEAAPRTIPKPRDEAQGDSTPYQNSRKASL